MPQDAFDSAEASAMVRAIEIVMSDAAAKDEAAKQMAARAVFRVASESCEIDPVKLAELARARLSPHTTRH